MAFFIMLFSVVKAQTDDDAIMIPKKYFCAGVMYSNSSWKDYWEGTFKRENQNIGTLSSNVYMAMVNYGISDKLNIMVNVPYITTHASAGTLAGQQGFQDVSAAVKWMPIEANLGKGVFSLYGIGTVGMPMTNYVADFQPMSIGIHAKSAAVRLLADYQISNLFFTGSGQYVQRSNITIDRTSYYTTSLIYSNQVRMPNAGVFDFRTGYRSEKLIAEAIVSNMTTYGGFDIRKNDMPFPSNKMNSTMVGVNAKYSFPMGLEFTAGGGYTVAGRNVGQAAIIHGGVYYLFDISSKKKAAKGAQQN